MSSVEIFSRHIKRLNMAFKYSYIAWFFLFSGANLCENAHITIRCYENKTLHIIYANYGRLNPTQCGFHNTTNCGAANSTAVIKNICEGRVSCEIIASYSVFGDPCPYVPKYLDVTYECSSSGE